MKSQKIMKHIFILLVFIIIGQACFAQKDLVTLDEHNKYIFYQVVDMPGINADTLYNRCVAGLKKIGPKPLDKPVLVANTSVNMKAKLMLYNNMGAVKHEEGELAYSLTIEFKDNKYRFWLTDFSFAPYQRNRYGVYERAHDEPSVLEEVKKKREARMFDTYLEQIAKYGSLYAEDLKKLVANPAKKQAEPAKVDTRKW